MHPVSQIRPQSGARLLIAAGLLAMLCALVVAGGKAPAAAAGTPGAAASTAGEESPSFVVIQTDDQTLDELYA
ncbi:MAG: hypothetical protein WBM00_09060, partial [Solirubrobacterales bacterium]